MSDHGDDTIERTTTGGRGLALVLSGGGARAAYQVGLLRAIARRRPRLRIPVLTGVSAGAINGAFLAAHPLDFAHSVALLGELWSTLSVQRVFRTDLRSITGHLLRWGYRLVSGGGPLSPRVKGLVDSSPLHRLLTEALSAGPDGEVAGIADNVDDGLLHAFAVLTSNYATGQSVVWIDGDAIQSWERPHRRSRPATITVDHIMASAALPFFFPAVELEGMWHGDGGIRLTNPLSPAIHMGADRILALSTRYPRSDEEAARTQIGGYPPPIQIGNQLLNAIFLDALDQDALRVERFNRLLAHLPEDKRHGLRQIDVEVLRPSQDLGKLAAELEPDLPKVFRHLVRSFGSRETASPDLLSLVMFQSDYCRRLMDLGEADADSRMDQILQFVDGESSDPPP